MSFSLTLTGCFETNEGEPFYGHGAPPQTQEFRWSDGGLPKTFDPALAAAPPDTDAVRALYEGLTDYDPVTLQPVPGVALRWESSADQREWTFYLRRDARWSNGDMVTAKDFVGSWKRTLGLGSRAPHAQLLENLVQAGRSGAVTYANPRNEITPKQSRRVHEKGIAAQSPTVGTKAAAEASAFGAVALSDEVLRVRLQRPDKDFASLVAHPIFRPVHNVQDDKDSDSALAEPIVSNGPFRLAHIAGDGVILERAVNYWDARAVGLNRVRFVATSNAEEALEKYRNGEVDAVTNAGFEPLALKLLAPYKDFRRVTFGALTFYSFNINRAPFSDVHVREAMAIVLDRERISEDEMDGASVPANTFLPSRAIEGVEVKTVGALTRDVPRAQKLLAEAGYPVGVGFPVVKLLVNRNDQQRLIAQSVAAMWRRSLGIETEVVVKSWDEYEEAVRQGDYDVVRRGTVMQTLDEAANLRAMFEPASSENAAEDLAPGAADNNSAGVKGIEKGSDKAAARTQTLNPSISESVLTQSEALKQLPAIPIYFASSYSLVRPYVVGFDNNLLDAPSLKRVRIDTSWQAPARNASGWFRIRD